MNFAGRCVGSYGVKNTKILFKEENYTNSSRFKGIIQSVLNNVRLTYLLFPRWTSIRFCRLSLSCISADFVGARAASARLVYHC